MSLDVTAIVEEVIAASPALPDTLEALTGPQRRELDHLVTRSRITPEAALAVLRGRRQEQHERQERAREADALVATITSSSY